MQTNSTFRTILSFFAIMMLSNTVAAGVVAAKALGCRDASKTNEGVDISFYSYEYGSKLSQRPDFFSKLYATTKVHSIPSYAEILDMMHIPESSGKPEMGDIYGYETTFTNFTALITGYYFAEETGKHTLRYAWTVGGASLRFGAGVESCTGVIDKDITDDFCIKILSATESADDQDFTTYLEKGVAYPVEMIVHNWEGNVLFLPSVIAPNGDEYLFQGSMFSSIEQTSRE